MCLKMIEVGPRWMLFLTFSSWLCVVSRSEYLELVPRCNYVKSHEGVSLVCKKLFHPIELIGPVEVTLGHKMLSMTLMNSTLEYLPHALFEGTSFEKMHLYNTVLMSLSDGKVALQGLEDSLTEFRASGTNYVSQWNLTQLQNLRKLKVLDISSITIKYISTRLGSFPSLAYMGITKANLSYIVNYAFADCPRLKIVGLNDNKLTRLSSRTIFPNPAKELTVINLANNELINFPENFFADMPSLTDVYLQDNQFYFLSPHVFENLFKYGSTLNMKRNHLRCDCKILWFKKLRSSIWFNADCARPDSLAGRAILYLEPWEMNC